MLRGRHASLERSSRQETLRLHAELTKLAIELRESEGELASTLTAAAQRAEEDEEGRVGVEVAMEGVVARAAAAARQAEGVVAALEFGLSQLAEEVRRVEGEGGREREVRLSHADIQASRIDRLERERRGLQAEKEAQAHTLKARLRRLEKEKADEIKLLHLKINKLQHVQQAALNANSARGRGLLYSEHLKVRQSILKESTLGEYEDDEDEENAYP